MAGEDFKKIVEEVRAANDIVEVIGSYVALRKAGSQYKGLSPFTQEKTPSFFVDPVKQVFKCWSSGHGGTVFDFIMLYEKCDFMTALGRLAERAGIDLARMRGASAEADRRRKLYQVCEAVAQFWAGLLQEHPMGEPARTYLRQRGVAPETWRSLRLGFAPGGWRATLQWARTQGMEPELLQEAGLVARSESGQYYDRFRERVIFPIRDEQGRTIGFSGRVLEDQAEAPKYINSPETPIFSKGQVLLGLDVAKRSLVQRGFALLCEGPMDWLQCYQAGFTHAIAVQGTALTEEQTRLLRRFCQRVIVCFDADPAGERATARSFELLLAAGLEVEILCLPGGEDPDSFLRRYGPRAFAERVESACPYIRFVLDILCRDHRLDRPGECARAAARMAGVLASIPDPVYREKALWEAAARLGVSARSLQEEVRRTERGDGPKELLQISRVTREGEIAHPAIQALVSLLLEHPELASMVSQELSEEVLQGLPGGNVLADLLAEELSGSWAGPAAFVDRVPKGPVRQWLAGLLLRPEPKDADLEVATYASALVERIRELWRQRRIELLEQEIRAGKGAPEELLGKTKELLDLKRQDR
jgi:DNA primase